MGSQTGVSVTGCLLQEAFLNAPWVVPEFSPARAGTLVTSEYNVLCACMCPPEVMPCAQSHVPCAPRLEKCSTNILWTSRGEGHVDGHTLLPRGVHIRIPKAYECVTL